MSFLRDVKGAHNLMLRGLKSAWDDPVNKINQTLFGELKEEGSQLADLAVDLNTKAVADDKLYAEGDINLPHLAYRHAGRAGEMFGGLVSGALDTVTPDAIFDPLAEGMDTLAEVGMATDIGKDAIKWLQDNPEDSKDIMAGVGIAEFGIPKALLAPIKRALSAAPNYIKNYYGPEIDTLKEMPANFEQLTNVLLKQGVKGVKTKKEAFTLAQQLTGVADWAIKGVKGGFKSIVNPKARALYDKHGINKYSQDVVKDEMKLYTAAKKRGDTDVANRHREKAIAQINYNKYITEQSARKGKVATVLNNVLKSVSYGGMQDLSKQNYIKSAGKQKVTNSRQPRKGQKHDVPLEASEADLSYAYDTALKAWGIPDVPSNRLVVKRNTGQGGNHGSDAAANKNKVNRYLRGVYVDGGTMTPEEIFTDLSSLLPNGKTKAKSLGIVINSKSLEEVTSKGLWLSGSQKGSGVVEGGINVLTKVLPNRRSMNFVSDEHDFLEKVPVAGKILGQALPNREFTLTPPSYVDLRNKKVKTKEKASERKREDIYNLDEGQGGVVSDQDIEDYMNARGSRAGIAAQVAVKMPAEALYGASVMHDYSNEQEQK